MPMIAVSHQLYAAVKRWATDVLREPAVGQKWMADSVPVC